MPRHRKTCTEAHPDRNCWCQQSFIALEDARELANGGPTPAGNPDDDAQEARG